MPASEQILKLVSQRQTMMKDAWLTATGHKRPEMKVGLPLEEARAKAAEIEKQIRALMK
jgi:S-methylmethionine-dependent homocysteine/selenocysteine methylase